MNLVCIVISFLASAAGSICGIGGGVIIKPVLDLYGIYSVSAISFMSGCTVLAMSTYSVVKSKLQKNTLIRKKIGNYLGLGAAGGGILGKQLFDIVKTLFADADKVGEVQAAVLFLFTLGTAAYTLCQKRIATRHVKNKAACVLIGGLLGIMSSFLGIGGGPINLVILYYFFSMDTKEAAENSLYMIFLSQAASLFFTIFRGNVPEISWMVLIFMIAAGILGGAAGRAVNRTVHADVVNKLFLTLLVIIMGICCYNFFV